jgi:hypothetical protein
MYRPNFCSDCGTKIVRLRWRLWTSRRFCGACARRLRKERWQFPLITSVVLVSLGLVSGRALRPAPPPLIIQRRADSPLAKFESGSSGPGDVKGNTPPLVVEAVYICGARTKKGTPCSRRVHQPARCWQHKGMVAMLPAEKLRIKD